MAKTSTQQRLLYCFVAAAILTVIGIIALAITRSKDDQSVSVKSMDSPQRADAPLGFPIVTEEGSSLPPFDPRFIQLTAFERALIPTATQMTSPMGSDYGALTYNAQPFWSDNTQRGGRHTGDDINGIGGMNTDLGDPVYAIASGLVVYRGEPSPGWGKTLILAHRTHQGQILLSMYAHLEKNYSPYGDLIYRGEHVGSVGTANLNYPAHLHLEMRDSTGVHIGAGYAAEHGEYVSAEKTIQSSRDPHPEHLHTPPLEIILDERLKLLKEGLSIQNKTNVTN